MEATTTNGAAKRNAIAVCVLAVVVLTCWLLSRRHLDPSLYVTAPTVELKTTYPDLLDSFHGNAVAAEQRLSGKLLTMPGTVSSIPDERHVLVSFGTTTIPAPIRPSARNAISDLHAGDKILLSCSSTKFSYGLLILDDCAVSASN